MKRLSIVLVLLMLLTVGLIAAGCGGDDETTTTAAPTETTAAPTETTTAPAETTTSAPAAGEPKTGGTVRVILGPDLQNAGGLPWELWGPQMMAGQFMLESLFMGSPEGEFVPWLAKSYELADDLMSATVVLNEGIKFHDGSDFNAESCAWNLQKYMEGGQAASFKSVEVVDPYTIKITFSYWANTNLLILRDGGWMISMESYETNGEEYARNNPVGTGPFKFVSFQNQVNMVMEKNPDYWVEGKPYLDGVEILFVADVMTQAAMLQAGEADVIGNQGLNKQASDLQAAGFVIETSLPECWAITPDAGNDDSPYKVQQVREAVEYALDREGLAEAFGYGFWEAALQIPGPDSYAYREDFELTRDYDPEKAKQLLAEGGYPDGFKTTILSHPFANQDAVVAVQAMLAEVGIDAEIRIPEGPVKYNEENNTLHNILAWQPVDALSGSWNQGFWYSFMWDGSGNANWLRSPEWVELYEASRATPTEDVELVRAVINQWHKEASVIPVTRAGNGWARGDYVMDGGWFSRSFSPWIKPWDMWLDQ
jgi:peptide/nickel transport system substrate-binding protein